jgi:hypothetical protein
MTMIMELHHIFLSHNMHQEYEQDMNMRYNQTSYFKSIETRLSYGYSTNIEG